MMKIRYQNGRAFEAVTLFRADNRMRVAVHGTDDVLELTCVSGVWVTEDCEPVSIEYPSRRAQGGQVREEDCICPAELAAHLIHLLLNDSTEDIDVEAEIEPTRERKSTTVARHA